MIRRYFGKVMDFWVAEMVQPYGIHQGSIQTGSHIRGTLPIIGPGKSVTNILNVLETSLHHCGLESFEE